MRIATPIIMLTLLVAGGSVDAVEGSVLSAFNAGDWVGEKWNKSAGTLSFAPEGAQGTPQSLKLDVHYAGTGFEWFTLNPANAISVPAQATALSLWIKGGKPGYPVVVKFRDAKGQQKLADKDLEWAIFDATADAWKQRQFEIPAAWEKPLTIYAIAVHNYEHQKDAVAVDYALDELAVVKR